MYYCGLISSISDTTRCPPHIIGTNCQVTKHYEQHDPNSQKYWNPSTYVGGEIIWETDTYCHMVWESVHLLSAYSFYNNILIFFFNLLIDFLDRGGERESGPVGEQTSICCSTDPRVHGSVPICAPTGTEPANFGLLGRLSNWATRPGRATVIF